MQTEQQLLRSFSEGDTQAAEALIQRFEDRLYNLCFRLTSNQHEAEDLFQQTWLKVLQKSKTYTSKSFQNWLYTICLNVYRDSYRKDTRRSQLFADNQEEAMSRIASASGSAESQAVENIAQEALLVRISNLPDKLKLPILLCYFEDLDYQGIAQVLNIPIGTVKSRLNTAKNKLRTEMESQADG